MQSEKISDVINPHTLRPLKKQVYWAMDQLESKDRDRFSIQEISSYLIKKPRINTSPPAVKYALNSAKNATHKSGNLYKLMQNGRDILESEAKERGVLLIEPGKPFSGKIRLVEEVFSKLNGDIKICDPYCGNGLLDLIFKGFNKKTSIKIITQQIIDKPTGIFSRNLKDLRNEGFDIRIKVYGQSQLHDRYVIDDNNFWFSGNSFNDLGNKESFIVLLGSDVRQSVLATFNSRWKAINAEY